MSPGSGETRTESCDATAKEDVAAIAFFGKLTLNGGLLRPGTVTRIVERIGGCDPAPMDGVRPLGALGIGPAALGESASLELARGDTFRRISPFASGRPELTAGLAGAFDSVVEDKSESVERTSAEYSEPRVLSVELSLEGVASSRLLVPAESRELANGGVGVREADSSP